MTMMGASFSSPDTRISLSGSRGAAALAGRLHFLERRPACGRDRPPRELRGYHRGRTLNEADHADAEAVVILRFGVVDLAHRSRQRSEQAVAEQDAQERTPQGRA